MKAAHGDRCRCRFCVIFNRAAAVLPGQPNPLSPEEHQVLLDAIRRVEDRR